jgi:hypothetical protein
MNDPSGDVNSALVSQRLAPGRPGGRAVRCMWERSCAQESWARGPMMGPDGVVWFFGPWFFVCCTPFPFHMRQPDNTVTIISHTRTRYLSGCAGCGAFVKPGRRFPASAACGLGVAVGGVALRPSHCDDPPVWNRSLFLGLLPLSRHHFLAPLALGQVRTVQNTRCGPRPSCSLPHFILVHSLCRILLGTDLALMSGRRPEKVVSPGAPSTVWWPVSRSF